MSASFMPSVFSGLKKAGDAIFKMRGANGSGKAVNVIVPYSTSSLMGWDGNGIPASYTVLELFGPYSTTAYVDGRISQLVNGAPSALDTLSELALQLQNDESAAAALTTQVASKLSKTNNLSDLADVNAARTNLGLNSAALQPVSAFATSVQGNKADNALPSSSFLWANIPDKPPLLKGDKGDTGLTGTASTVPGPQGIQGVVGSVGPIGQVGAQGVKGDAGSIGATGPASSVPGPQGATGPQGAVGLTGAKGDAGLTGATGSASTIAGPQGAQGAIGQTGPTGSVGSQGIQGIAGINATTTATATTTTAGLMPASAVVQLANVLTPLIKFTMPVVPLTVGNGPVDGFLVDRATQLKGFSYATTSAAGTSLSYTISLVVNGASITGSSVSLGINAASGSIVIPTPVTLAKGDKVELMRNVTAAVAVTASPISYVNIQATFI